MKYQAAVLLAICLSLTACHSPFYADRGAAIGGLSGALAGAAIGEDSGNAGAGAVIGGAVGSLAGGAIGESIDRDFAASQAIIEERLGRRISGAATVSDVIAMTQANLSEDVISTHIRASGVARPPQVDDLITMRNAGVTDRVIQVMQQTPPPAEHVSPPHPPVIVEEHHYVAPAPWHPPRRPVWRPGRGRGIRWGVSFGN